MVRVRLCIVVSCPAPSSRVAHPATVIWWRFCRGVNRGSEDSLVVHRRLARAGTAPLGGGGSLAVSQRFIDGL